MFRNLFKKLFLSREIKSREGVLHFRRWRLFWTPIFAIYIHQIFESDKDKHLHSHPWNFISFILSGGYVEINSSDKTQVYTPGNMVVNDRHTHHRILLIEPTTSLVFTFGTPKMWGYMVGDEFVPNDRYRQRKVTGEFDDEE
jgi:hypothetical protein